MRLEEVELRRVRMPLRAGFASSAATTAERHVLLVRVAGSGAEGWGECAAPDQPSYTSEYVEAAHALIRSHLLPRLFSLPDPCASQVAPALAGVKGHPMAKAALQTAVLDAELRHHSRSLASFLGGVRDRVPAGVAVGVAGSLDQLLDEVAGFVEQGYLRVKLKIGPGWDLEPVRAVRERFGPDLMLQVDANGAYSVADAAHLEGLDAFGLVMLEQPLAEDDLAGHAELARRLATPICLDESITSARAAASAIALGACSVVNVKAGRVGGLLEARAVHDVCVAAGVPAWCGGMLETGLGRAANLALAALPGFTLPGDLSASERYWDRDITVAFHLEDGHLRVPSGPGLGVAPDPEVLAELTTSVERTGWGS